MYGGKRGIFEAGWEGPSPLCIKHEKLHKFTQKINFFPKTVHIFQKMFPSPPVPYDFTLEEGKGRGVILYR